MDRVMIYPGAIPLETDLLTAQKNDMIGLAKLAAAVLGTATQVNGLACTPTNVPSMQVTVGAGEIYSLQNIDNSAYSSIAADTAHQIVKQGILLDAATLTTAAPATAGMSVVYLVEAAYIDVDTLPVTLPYYNSSNPSQAYSGPANAGTTNNTARKGQCSVQLKTGIAATTGSQVAPAADAGYVALYAITVANGQTTVLAANIATVSSAPFVGAFAQLNALNVFSQFQSGPTPTLGDATTKYATMAAVQAAAALLAKLTGATFSGDVVIGVDSQTSAATAALHLQTVSTTVGNAVLAMSTLGDEDVQITKVRGVTGLSILNGSGVADPLVVAAATLATQAVNFSQVLGLGQAWQNLTASRVFGTTYTNSTGKPIFISVFGSGSPNNCSISIIVSSITLGQQGVTSVSSAALYATMSGIVPAGATYSAVNNSGATLQTWMELR